MHQVHGVFRNPVTSFCERSEGPRLPRRARELGLPAMLARHDLRDEQSERVEAVRHTVDAAWPPLQRILLSVFEPAIETVRSRCHSDVLHLSLGVDDLLAVLAMALLRGFNGRRVARWTAFVLPSGPGSTPAWWAFMAA